MTTNFNEGMIAVGLTVSSIVVGALSGMVGAGVKVGKAAQRLEDRLKNVEDWKVVHEVQGGITLADTISKLNIIMADIKEIDRKVAFIQGQLQDK